MISHSTPWHYWDRNQQQLLLLLQILCIHFHFLPVKMRIMSLYILLLKHYLKIFLLMVEGHEWFSWVNIKTQSTGAKFGHHGAVKILCFSQSVIFFPLNWTANCHQNIQHWGSSVDRQFTIRAIIGLLIIQCLQAGPRPVLFSSYIPVHPEHIKIT